MLSLGTPAYFVAALGAAALVTALHFLSWRRPTPLMLPTARFVRAAPLRAVSREIRFNDVAILLTRVLAIVLLGLALARPRLTPAKRGEATVVLSDRSRAVARIAEVHDSLTTILQPGGTARIVWFDSAPAMPLDGATRDSATLRSEARASLSAALVAALREGETLARTHARVRLTIVSPLVREEFDAATTSVRREWSDSIRLVRVTARTDSSNAMSGLSIERDFPSVDDPVGAAMRLAVAGEGSVTASSGDGPAAARRLTAIREPFGAADSAKALAGSVVLVWPPIESRSDSTVRVTSVSTSRHTAIGAFIRTKPHEGGTPIAWDAEGSVVAREQSLGAGCVRWMDFAPPMRGDLALRTTFTIVARDLSAPCGDVDWDAPSPSVIARLTNPLRPVHDDQRASRNGSTHEEGSAPRWLLLGVLGMLVLEWWLRRMRTSPAALRAGGALVDEREEAA